MASPTYDEVISRGGSLGDGGPGTTDMLVPEPIVNSIIQELPRYSAARALARQVTMSSKTVRQPVLTVLPEAYWVSGDTGLKQTTKPEWDGIQLVAEELATIVVIPDAYFDDTSIPLWDEVRPLIAQAIGAKLDLAVLFGTEAPATWGDSIVEKATSVGNVVTAGLDLADDIASLGETLSTEGFGIDGFASRPGFGWHLSRQRDKEGRPVFTPSTVPGVPGSLYGYPANEVRNGGWDVSAASLIAGQWDKCIIGVRQDISVRIFSEGVVSDGSGAVVVNLMQQDSKAMRVIARFGFATANPVTTLESDERNRYPFGVLLPGGASG